VGLNFIDLISPEKAKIDMAAQSVSINNPQ
jgi:hypothetical protein